MNAAKGGSRLQPWRARWRELGTRMKGAGRRTAGRAGENHLAQTDVRAGTAVHRNPHAASPTWVDAVEQARQDWMHARSYFDSVEDPDLIDHAIYQVQAAESRYMYLLRKVRESYEQHEGRRKIDGRSLAGSPSS